MLFLGAVVEVTMVPASSQAKRGIFNSNIAKIDHLQAQSVMHGELVDRLFLIR